METKVVEFNKTKTKLDYVRNMSKEEFIENHGSGTLRKAKRIGVKHNSLYWEERICYDFGWEFQMKKSTYVTHGPAMVEGDNKSSTEFGWFAERYMMTRVFDEDIVEPCFIQYEEDGIKKEGNGLIIKQTSLDIPKGNVIFAIISEFNIEKNEWEHARNPF